MLGVHRWTLSQVRSKGKAKGRGAEHFTKKMSWTKTPKRAAWQKREGAHITERGNNRIFGGRHFRSLSRIRVVLIKGGPAIPGKSKAAKGSRDCFFAFGNPI